MLADDRRDAWAFYWRTDIPVREIAELYGFDPRHAVDAVGTATLPCTTCNKPVVLTSRQRLMRIWRDREECICDECLAPRIAAAQAERARHEQARQHEREMAELRRLEAQAARQRFLDLMLPIISYKQPTPLPTPRVLPTGVWLDGTPEAELIKIATIDGMLAARGFDDDDDDREQPDEDSE